MATRGGEHHDPDLSPYVEGWQRRVRVRHEREATRREYVHARLPEIVHVLATCFGARRIVLFGSFARGDATLQSDVDLLVEGIDPSRLMEASAAADRILAQTRVDLVPIERARPEVRSRAEVEGHLLHG